MMPLFRFPRLLLVLAVLSMLLAAACSAPRPTAKPDAAEEEERPIDLPLPPQEFRAAWVATVANINWPSAPGLSPDSQRTEALALLDLLARHHYNAVILQVRPQADALYPSELEPWSYYLTGEQGKPPQPFYDPLAFWIEEAHHRGLELHAWLNPYRAHHPSGGPVTEASIAHQRPELARRLTGGFYWMDPGEPQTRHLTQEVVLDLVRRYPLDGIHFDDYFYPYPSYNGGADFPDSVSFTRYRRQGGTLERADWRRENVNTFILELYDTLRQLPRPVKLGLSPFGIWRPGHPASIAGFDQHEGLYANARRWLREGWIDYYAPQLYWPISQVPQSFPVLLGWWEEQNVQGRHLWPGIRLYRDSTRDAALETVNQIMITRGMLPQSPGTLHWSIAPLQQDSSLRQALLQGPYREPALLPPTPWLEGPEMARPTVSMHSDQDTPRLQWKVDSPTPVLQWIVYLPRGDGWTWRILPGGQDTFVLPFPAGEEQACALVAVGPHGKRSPAAWAYPANHLASP